MKKSILLSFIFIVFLLFMQACCLIEKEADLELKSLSGLWMSEGNLLVYEEWQSITDSVFQGKSFSINGTDTLVFETLRIAAENNKLFYFAKVADQNENKEVGFQLVNSENGRWVFENLQHDYPNRIIYQLTSDTGLIARIENSRGNQSKEFHFKKLK